MKSLNGCNILVVEDEALIAMTLEMQLRAAGCKITGPVPSVSEALTALSANAVDACVLDINLAGEVSFPVADRLDDLVVPFVFLTGHSNRLIPKRHSMRPVLGKPHDPIQLTALLTGLIAQPRALAT